MIKTPQTLTDVNIFIDGIGHLGTSKKITLPKIEQLRETITAGGFERSVDLGIFKELDSEFTLSEYSPIVLAAMAAGQATGLGVNITVKGSFFQDGKRTSILATLQGSIDLDDGDMEAKKEVERKVSMKPWLYAMEIDGKQGLMLDTKNMIAIIDGVDYLSDLRAHIQ
ncbi:phage major tail tube protein [Poseidonibacter lekithochrous]|uniref:phage major tail tube protein n=1 Tax=Poseidonibacter lekithochrous TaxID=1904463 RepID=UPI000D384A19|nr:phage major tail tube protein [Poseidonibacter lekithochrous]